MGINLKEFDFSACLITMSRPYGETYFDTMFKFFIENKFLIATNQSTFKANDSYISQLMSITHDIYKPFDEGYVMPQFVIINLICNTCPTLQ